MTKSTRDLFSGQSDSFDFSGISATAMSSSGNGGGGFLQRFLDRKVDVLDRLVEYTVNIGEATGNYDPLLNVLRIVDRTEARNFNNPNTQSQVDELRDIADEAVDALNDANEFRKAPSFDGSHIDWLIGQNLAVAQDARSKGVASEGNVDYFNINNGSGGGLIGDGTEFTGGNNVIATMADAAANGGKIMTVGVELNSFSGSPTEGIDTVSGFWADYQGGLIPDNDLVAYIDQKASEGVAQAQALKTFAEAIANEGATLEAVHVRPGYEFDADFNNHTIDEYKDTFRFMAEYLKGSDGLGLTNVKMVWQSQSGAERSPNDIYDEANGADAPITKEDVFDHLDLWYPGDEYVDVVGMSLFQTEESARSWMFADGTANDQLPVMDDFDVFLQAFADYAVAHGKTLDISESSPAGAYLDRDQFNELVTERLAELGEDYDGPLRLLEEGEVAYAKFHTDTNPDNAIPGGVYPEQFFDDSDPNYFVGSTAQIWNEYFVPFFQFVERNADVIDSINMISYNWDEVPLFESLITDADTDVPLAVNFGSGNWFDNPELAGLINDYVTDTFL